jgi:lysozyme
MPLSDLFAALGRLFGKNDAAPTPVAAVPPLSISPSSVSTAVTSPAWIDLCEPLTQASEGCQLKAYPDPGSGGVPYTCGWGSTGPDVTASTVWTQQEADNRLRVDLVAFGYQVDSAVTVPLSAQQKAALVDFTYNVGFGNLKSSTLLKKLNAGDYAGAADQFPLWNKAAGKVMSGLVTRRARERDLFLTGAWK